MIMRLGMLDYHVLMASQWAGAGVAIQATIQKRTGHRYTTGSVYASLYRLHRRKYVTSWKDKPTPKRGGRAQIIYGITATGAAALEETSHSIAKMAGRK